MSDLEGIDWIAFRESIMRPPQPHLAAALDVVRDLMAERGMNRPPSGQAADFVAEAWERAATRLDHEYLLEGSGRAFLRSPPTRTIYYTDGGYPGTPRPPESEDAPGAADLTRAPVTASAVVALMASDPGALLAAEELAREACRRLAPWGYPEPRLIAWTHVERGWPGREDWRTPFDVPAYAAHYAQHDRSYEARRAVWDAMSLPYSTLTSDVEAIPAGFAQRMAATVGDGWIDWRKSVRARARIGLGPDYLGPVPQDLSEAVVRKRFADVEDPLDPLLVLWGSGFVPIDLRYDVMILGVTLPASMESLVGHPPPPPGLSRPRRGRRKRA